jgi:hypothetical protein
VWVAAAVALGVPGSAPVLREVVSASGAYDPVLVAKGLEAEWGV